MVSCAGALGVCHSACHPYPRQTERHRETPYQPPPLDPPGTPYRHSNASTSAQQFAHQRRLFGDHGEEHLGGASRSAAAMLPAQQRALGNADAAGESGLRQAGAGPDRGDIDGGHLDMVDNGPVNYPSALRRRRTAELAGEWAKKVTFAPCSFANL